ncbi:UNKNOWN [Stylonychia lemnae]|uniref:Cyclic nucleotide-binding domain-containing protein n=1 Tax=Stylonychia lemnae TaxID=5949 RepID=A0A078BCF2_STYLE|nr:UNKNOWN [Stylonychia lemnae]|eukprot:CDW91288.1 UNKNOWN [Stylonychia lemnae]
MYGLMTVLYLQENQDVPMRDFNQPDFVYVIQGSIKVELTKFVDKDNKTLHTCELDEGKFVDPEKRYKDKIKNLSIDRIYSTSAQTIEFKQDTLIENENEVAKYVYLVLRGEIKLMKRPEFLYDKNGKIIKTIKQLEFIKNPIQSEEHLGIELGIVTGENFLCEDSGLFNLPLSYSAVAKTDVIVYRISSQEMLQTWPKECINEMKIKVLEKYRWFYDRLIKIEEYLLENQKNFNLLQGAKDINRHIFNNYPQGSEQARDQLKKTHLKLADQNYKIYLTSQNRRMHKYSKPLTNYIQDDDLKRLEQLREQIFGYEKPEKQHKNRYKQIDPNSETKDQYHHLSSLGMLAPNPNIKNDCKIIDYDYMKTQSAVHVNRIKVMESSIDQEAETQAATIFSNQKLISTAQHRSRHQKRAQYLQSINKSFGQIDLGYDKAHTKKVALAAQFTSRSLNIAKTLNIRGEFRPNTTANSNINSFRKQLMNQTLLEKMNQSYQNFRENSIIKANATTTAGEIPSGMVTQLKKNLSTQQQPQNEYALVSQKTMRGRNNIKGKTFVEVPFQKYETKINSLFKGRNTVVPQAYYNSLQRRISIRSSADQNIYFPLKNSDFSQRVMRRNRLQSAQNNVYDDNSMQGLNSPHQEGSIVDSKTNNNYNF